MDSIYLFVLIDETFLQNSLIKTVQIMQLLK